MGIDAVKKIKTEKNQILLEIYDEQKYVEEDLA